MQYFKKYLEVAPFSHSLWRALEANQISQIKLKKPILDIGCGFGEFAGVVFKNKLEVGIDIDGKDLILAAKKKKYKNLVLADARNLPFEDGKFSTVVSVSTLEHIPRVELVFAQIYRVIKKGGVFIFTVPTSKLNEVLRIPCFFNKLGLNFISRLYLNVFHKAFKHEVIISKKEWEKMTKKAGFKIISVKELISERQIFLFEIGLIFALPTQIFRLLFDRRLPFSPNIRVKLLTNGFKKYLNDANKTEANVIFVCKK